MPPKRKATIAASPSRLPVPRGRSARTPKDSPAQQDGGQESFDFQLKPAKRNRRTAGLVAKADEGQDENSGLPEYGRGASKPATVEQHLLEQSRKSKQFIQNFKDQVASRRDRCQEVLESLKQDLLSSGDQSSYSSSPTDDLTSLYTTLRATATFQPTTSSSSSSSSSSSLRDHPLFEQTQQLLRLSRAILECHRKTDKAVSSSLLLPPPCSSNNRGSGVGSQQQQHQPLASPRETWMRDEEGMRRLLEWGKIFGERVVEGWIAPGADGDGEEEEEEEEENENGERNESGDGDESWDEGMMAEAERLARGLFDKRKEGLKGEESWGAAARKQMVALAGLVGTLPGRRRGE